MHRDHSNPVREWATNMFPIAKGKDYTHARGSSFGLSRTGDSSCVRVIPGDNDFHIFTGTKTKDYGLRVYPNIMGFNVTFRTDPQLVVDANLELGCVRSMDSQGQTLVVGTNDGCVAIIDGKRFSVAQSFQMGEPNPFVCWAENSNAIMIATGSSVSKYDVESLTPISRFSILQPEALSFHHNLHGDTSDIACCSWSKETMLFDFRTNHPTAVIKMPGGFGRVNINSVRQDCWAVAPYQLSLFDLRRFEQTQCNLAEEIGTHQAVSLHGLYRDKSGKGVVGNAYGSYWFFDAHQHEVVWEIPAPCSPIDFHWNDEASVMGVAIHNAGSGWSMLDAAIYTLPEHSHSKHHCHIQ